MLKENRSSDYKFKKHDIINVKSGCVKILEPIRIELQLKDRTKKQKGYKYQCLNCNHIGESYETHIYRGDGCPVCANKKVIRGVNDIWTTNQHLGSLLANPEDGYKYTQSSGQRVDWKCPDCGEIIKNMKIVNINKDGLSCPKCGDGISYGEKILFNVLQQLNIEFKTQTKFKWSENKKYDFYIGDSNSIIEIHGLQHYNEGFGRSFKSGRTLIQEQVNDKLKEQLAKENGITNYIVIDARKSELEWIKQNLINNIDFNSLFDLSTIDWLKCHEYGCKSIIKTTCDLWNSGITNMSEIGRQLKLNRVTIYRHLKQGSQSGMCQYTPKNYNILI